MQPVHYELAVHISLCDPGVKKIIAVKESEIGSFMLTSGPQMSEWACLFNQLMMVLTTWSEYLYSNLFGYVKSRIYKHIFLQRKYKWEKKIKV